MANLPGQVRCRFRRRIDSRAREAPLPDSYPTWGAEQPVPLLINRFDRSLIRNGTPHQLVTLLDRLDSYLNYAHQFTFNRVAELSSTGLIL